jgi:2-polyprenyl-3-methyl-5-hydroxy-6-metoxy-1,4-benzoquinol methylase
VEVASSPADDWLRLNRAWWDERAPVHAASEFYDVPGFLAGKDSMRAFEPGEVGDVRGKRLLHLMCHIGLDTLSWAGAVVTGLDFSQAVLDTAVSLAGQAGIGSARFAAAEIGDASRALAGETFDIVYTGTGVMQWIAEHDPHGRLGLERRAAD